ncbi:MAG TPA: hypothetical protein VNO82_01805 [Solirubrobacteraceae bacterium]|nr:hypothetical protein [Solirubrobacteraceae bacterium]
MTDPRDVALGLAVVGAEVGVSAGRAIVTSARLAGRLPLVGHVARRVAGDLAHEGSLARARLDTRTDVVTVQVARMLAERHVIERFAAEMLAVVDVDALVATMLEHERTQQALERALVSPGLERLLVQVLESRLVDELTERVLASPELERVVEYVAESPQVLDAVTRQTQSLATEMADGVRARTHSIDDVAERTVRGWLRRPRPQMG